MEQDITSSPEAIPLNSIRVETAISRFPVHRLARRGNIEINIQEGKKSGVQTRWEVDYSKKHGQPGPLAYKLDTLLINRRIEESPRPIPKMIRLGSLKEICRELGMAETGGNTNQIKKSLFQNALAGITAKTIYRDADGTERTLEAVFTRYSVILTGEKLPDGRKADAVYVMLNEIFMQVINGAMTRPLDYDYLKSLPPAPQRFYELLSYQMYAALKYDRPRAKLTYSDFCAHAPQTRHTDWERVRSQMNKVHRPHKLSGYVLHVDFQQTTDPSGIPDWIMLYQPGPKARAEFRAFTKRGGPTVLEMEPFTPDLVPQITAAASSVEAELTQRGVSPAVAAELVRQHEAARLATQMEHLDWLCEKKPGKIADPGAWLVSAIRTAHAAPKGFVSKAERQLRQDAKQAKEREAAEARRQNQQKEASERAKNQAIESYYEGLSPDERIKLDADAQAVADPVTLKLAEPGPMQKFGLKLIRDQFIARQLQSQGKLPGIPE